MSSPSSVRPWHRESSGPASGGTRRALRAWIAMRRAQATAKEIGTAPIAHGLEVATKPASARDRRGGAAFGGSTPQCAGITGRTNVPGHEVDLADFDMVYRVNLRGAFLLSKSVLPHMLARKYGRVLHVASIAGKEGNAGMTAYSATKAGLIGMVKSLAKDYVEHGITIKPRARGHPHGDGRCLPQASRLHDGENSHGPLRRAGGGGADDRLDRFTGLQLHHRLHLRS
jgi:hypothetical protein